MAAGDRYVFSIKDLTRYLKGLLERDRALQDLWVRGEISNFVSHSSGHLYFTLKDAVSQLRCVCFHEDACRLAFAPQDGMAVLVRGRVTIYERAGQYQLYVSEMTADGVGSLYVAFEQLKARLEAEGLFRPERKRPLPRFPRRLALLTSPVGAVFHDFTTIMRRRWPAAEILFVPVLVSGAGAAPSLVAGLELAARAGGVEVVVLARGGGSLEELWPFNDERLARAIARCPVPVVSAVGHETDFTIADFVADLRAATPSAAAELLGPDRQQVGEQVAALRHRAARGLVRAAAASRHRLELARARRPLASPATLFAPWRQRLDEARNHAGRAAQRLAADHRATLRALAGKLSALSPDAVLQRGYTITRTVPDGPARSYAALPPGAAAEVIFHDGSIVCQVEKAAPGAGRWRKAGNA